MNCHANTVAEGLKLIPPGTHDWKMFVKPKELFFYAEKLGFKKLRTVGEWPLIIKSIRNKKISVRECKNLSLGYAAFFSKQKAIQ